MTDASIDTHDGEPSRRDFIHIATGAFAAVGAGLVAWPFIVQMNPAADTLALASTEVDLSLVDEGSEITIIWRGRPVFVRHRTAEEIAEAEAVDVATLRDPQTDDERLVPGPDGELRRQYLIMLATCTHLGCVPLGDGAGDYGGWFCPCHGSHYDTSGRIRRGPAPLNLVVPEYTYLDDSRVRIG